MDERNVVINAHGHISPDSFMVAPPGTKVALVGTPGTVLHSEWGIAVDFDRPEFLTWYYPGDAMPLIKLNITNTMYDATTDFLGNTFFNDHSVVEDVTDLDDFVASNPNMTIYILCCLKDGPAEFNPVRQGKTYNSRYHRHAPPIRGITPAKDDVLVQTSPLLLQVKDEVHASFIVHPSLCPGLFKSLFVDRKDPRNEDLSVMWVHTNQYWEVFGSGKKFEDMINDHDWVMSGFSIAKAKTPFSDKVMKDGLTDNLGLGIIFTNKIIDTSGKKGIYLVNRVNSKKTMAIPIWDAWKVEPIRGGGLAIPAAAKEFRRGEVYTGDIHLLRGGEGVPWVPRAANHLVGGDVWVDKRLSVTQKERDFRWKKTKVKRSRFRISKSAVVRRPEPKVSVRYVQGTASSRDVEFMVIPANLTVVLLNSPEQFADGVILPPGATPALTPKPHQIGTAKHSYTKYPTGTTYQENDVMTLINIHKTHRHILDNEEVAPGLDLAALFARKRAEKNGKKEVVYLCLKYDGVINNRHISTYAGMALRFVSRYTRIAPPISFLDLSPEENLFESLAGYRYETANPFYLLSAVTCKNLFKDIFENGLKIPGCTALWVRPDDEDEDRMLYRVAFHDVALDEDYLFKDLNGTLGMKAVLDTKLDLGYEFTMSKGDLGYGLLITPAEFQPLHSGGRFLDYNDRRMPVFDRRNRTVPISKFKRGVDIHKTRNEFIVTK